MDTIVRRTFRIVAREYPKRDDGTVDWHHPVETPHLVEVTVDFQRLARELGPSAVKAKGKKATEAGGAVIVRPVKA